jgi:hypothetical protein
VWFAREQFDGGDEGEIAGHKLGDTYWKSHVRNWSAVPNDIG